uniref:CCHC-type domain-containing protein n=1 Tax=Tanacetum cinerariifolium TaxID=118510 RepID=A0A699GUN7_TANCI|nr:hypothetical protein [Tanacetum cinerariifolium]
MLRGRLYFIHYVSSSGALSKKHILFLELSFSSSAAAEFALDSFIPFLDIFLLLSYFNIMAKKDMDLYHSWLTHDDLNELIIRYKIPRDLNPRLPSKEFVMFDLPDDAIDVYHCIFDLFLCSDSFFFFPTGSYQFTSLNFSTRLLLLRNYVGGDDIVNNVSLRKHSGFVEFILDTRKQVFEICKCAEEDKFMFAASTFEGRALTWWNGNVHTLGLININHIPWTEFKSMMTTEYYPVTEIQRMEEELWTLTLKGDDIEAYNNRFHELALMCPDLVPNEKKKIKRYIKGFPERIKGNITSSRPTTLHDAINLACELVEQAVQGKAARNRRQETGRAYATTLAEGMGYNGNLPWFHRCKTHHHQGPCPPKCSICNNLGHQEKDCRVRILATGGNVLQDVTCFGCGEKGHFRHKCSKGKNQQNEGARVRAYVVVEDPQQNPNVVTGTFLLNDHYASVLFDSGAERSFVSIEFTPFINISPVTLNTSYEVELADWKVVITNTVLRSCTLALFSHVFKIDLLPTRLGERPEKDLKSLLCIKADEKRLDDIRTVRDFPEVFLKELTVLPPVREMQFHIDLILGALPVVKSP